MPTYRIPYLAVARFSGDDAGSFLQSQLSADILALEPGSTGLACYCTPKGQVLGLLLIGRREDDYLLAAKDVLLPGILRRLKMYVMRSKVMVEDASDIQVAGKPGPQYDFVKKGNGSSDDPQWRSMELKNGISWLNTGSAEKFIPQMLGFDAIGAVSFNKGCYPGQEIVARARYLGKVKRKPLVFETVGIPQIEPGEKVQVRRGDSWSGAVVVDHAFSTEDTVVVFTVAPAEPDTPVEEMIVGEKSYRCATT